MLEYPNQDSIYVYAIFHRANLKQDYLNSFPPKISCSFYTLLPSNYIFDITAAPQICYRIIS